MPVPVLLVTGFLGAGKTTLVNRLLSEPQGRRLAVVVNDFGALDIDAALLSGVSDGVISLQNGCICCSLLGDLLQTLDMILRRDPEPDGIVIETSGVSNPAEIVRTFLDPVIWKAAALDTVIGVADARSLIDDPGLFGDALWQAQLGAADFVALSKTDLVSIPERDLVMARLSRHKEVHAIYDMIDGRLPGELLFSPVVHRRPTRSVAPSGTPLPAFQSVSWMSREPLDMAGFQKAVGRYAGSLIRAKGFVTFIDRPEETMLFQFVGTRATISRTPARMQGDLFAQLVFIARRGALDEFALTASLAGCRGGRSI
jgi:cobalamin biosynthesis protein CobW